MSVYLNKVIRMGIYYRSQVLYSPVPFSFCFLCASHPLIRGEQVSFQFSYSWREGIFWCQLLSVSSLIAVLGVLCSLYPLPDPPQLTGSLHWGLPRVAASHLWSSVASRLWGLWAEALRYTVNSGHWKWALLAGTCSVLVLFAHIQNERAGWGLRAAGVRNSSSHSCWALSHAPSQLFNSFHCHPFIFECRTLTWPTW